MRTLALSVLTIGLSAIATPAHGAQPTAAGRELVGLVRDARGAAMEGVVIEIPGVATRTDGRGAFRLYTADLDTVTLTIRRLGYSVVSALLHSRNRQWDTVMVEMEELPQRLATAEVKAAMTTQRIGLRDFEERRAKGLGQFYSRDEIAARNTVRTSDVLRGARGVNVVKLRSGGFGVRFASHSQNSCPERLLMGPRAQCSVQSCIPTLWLDGQRARDMEVDEVPANQIEGIELYESWASTPPHFTAGGVAPCGTIVIWSRIPGA